MTGCSLTQQWSIMKPFLDDHYVPSTDLSTDRAGGWVGSEMLGSWVRIAWRGLLIGFKNSKDRVAFARHSTLLIACQAKATFASDF